MFLKGYLKRKAFVIVVEVQTLENVERNLLKRLQKCTINDGGYVEG